MPIPIISEDITRTSPVCELSLSGGIGWRFAATPSMLNWLEEFKRILLLPHPSPPPSPARSLPYYLFTCEADLPGHCEPALMGSWQRADLGTIVLFREENSGNVIAVIKDNNSRRVFYLNMWHALQPLYHSVLDRHGLPIHAALLENNGAGVLLVGSGGTGKSTCSRMASPPWKALSDDEAIILPDNGNKGGNGISHVVHSLPTWSDYLLNRSQGSWDVHREVPLKAIFFLERAEKDEVHPVGQGNAAVLIHQSAVQVMRRKLETGDELLTPEVKKSVFSVAGELAVRVPAYRLRVLLGSDFTKIIDSVLFSGR